MQIPAQNGHGNILIITGGAFIAADFHAVSGHKGVDRRFDSGAPFADRTKFSGAFADLVGLTAAPQWRCPLSPVQWRDLSSRPFDPALQLMMLTQPQGPSDFGHAPPLGELCVTLDKFVFII